MGAEYFRCITIPERSLSSSYNWDKTPNKFKTDIHIWLSCTIKFNYNDILDI
jgi:hypothetical protein